MGRVRGLISVHPAGLGRAGLLLEPRAFVPISQSGVASSFGPSFGCFSAPPPAPARVNGKFEFPLPHSSVLFLPGEFLYLDSPAFCSRGPEGAPDRKRG